jgi:hypothetical protein
MTVELVCSNDPRLANEVVAMATSGKSVLVGKKSGVLYLLDRVAMHLVFPPAIK